MKKVAVGLSGGVDSAVTALLLKRQGFAVVGVHLYCWPPKSEIEKDGITREEWIKKNGCRADEDRSAALKTALELEIPFKVLDFSDEYNKRVVSYFYAEYEAGRTPNPDVLCNSEIKFGLFMDWAMKNGFDYVATGHYAKLLNEGGIKLMIPKDRHKDQTYFLWKLTQKELSRSLFPLGDYFKDEVRSIAKEAKLSVADRKDSQGICFVGPVDVKEFLARRLRDNPGVVVNLQGEVLGAHEGVWHYTIGERGGWEINPSAQRKLVEAGKTPILYVIDKDAKKNLLIVGEADEAVENKFEVGEINTILREDWGDAVVRIRHGGELLKAGMSKTEKGLSVVLGKAVRGVASGQSAVFYSHNGEVLGGGVII